MPGNYHVSLPKYGRMVVCKQKWRLVNDELYNIEKDPEQKMNIAGEYPNVVEELKEIYEIDFSEIKPNTEKKAWVHIGSDKQNVTKLTLTGVTPFEYSHAEWSMDAAILTSAVNGKWPVFIEQDGLYEIELRRWPRELDRPINDYKGLRGRFPIHKFHEDAVQIEPGKADIKIADIGLSKKINPSDKKVVFQTQLKKGPADLTTAFIDSDGSSRIAYWVYVSKL